MKGSIAIFLALLVGLHLVAPAAAITSTGQERVTLTVSVTTPEDEPVGGAELTASWNDGSSTARTASNGKAFVDVPPGANVTITMNHSDYVRNFPVTVMNASEQEVSITVHKKVEAALVVSDDDGSLEGATVRFTKRRQPAIERRSDENGVARSGPIEAGEYTVTVFKTGYLRERFTLSIDTTVRREVTIEEGTVTITINVRDPHFDPPVPVEQARIEVPNVGSLNTGSNGVQRVNVPVNARFDIAVKKDGYDTVTRSVTVFEQEKTINVSLQRTPAIVLEPLNQRVVAGETLLVSAVDEYGDPVRNATVYRDGDAVGTTNAQGEARISIETKGDHNIWVERNGLRSEDRTVTGISPDTDTPLPSPTPSPPETETPTPTETGALTPGFGIVGALAAFLALRLGFELRGRGRNED